MNENEEKIYKEIRKELEQSIIEKRVNTYITNRNELTHYYNVGKMLIDAQGGEEKAKYGDGLIKNYSERLTSELGKGYDTSTLKRMRKFYLMTQKGAQLAHQLSWSHYSSLLPLNDINEINYYIDQTIMYHWGRNTLRDKIKNKEYQRLSDETKNKLIRKEELNIYDSIKNPITINTFDANKEEISEKVLKKFILRDMDNFLLQLGKGFSYIANEYKIQIENLSNYIDILLFNYTYNCFVVVELKVTNSKKDHLGQIMVYMNYIDKHLKNASQSKTIGIIVCRKDNKYLIEYSSDDRIRITTYELV